MIDVHGDSISHTSDYFDQLYYLAVKIIKEGKAYADDTEQMQVQRLNLFLQEDDILRLYAADASRTLRWNRVQAPRR